MAALARQIQACDTAIAELQQAFARTDTHPERLGNGTRLFSQIAWVLQGLDALPSLRQRVAARTLAAEQATGAFVRLVGGLLAVVFEAADNAADPGISRLLVAMFNFMQGKEFAGQERAVGAAVFSSGRVDAARQQHWVHLVESQERCFGVFMGLGTPGPLALWQACRRDDTLATLERLRRVALTAPDGAAVDSEAGARWFDCCSERIDAMQSVEAKLAMDLLQLCNERKAAAQEDLHTYQALLGSPAAQHPDDSFLFQPLSSDETVAPGWGYGPRMERSARDLVDQQARRLRAMEGELATVRASLEERKTIERAKGLLMARRRLSEDDAHRLLRQTAMAQHRRLVDVAASVLAMPD
jgi:nitrate/nitrite sensing protein/ANTAR domain-containing protein